MKELFRQIAAFDGATRAHCNDKLMSLPGAALTKALLAAENVLGIDEVPEFMESIKALDIGEQSAALGALATQLLSLHHLRSHDFAQLCETHYEKPWPQEAAASLLRNIGWLSPPAREHMTAIANGEERPSPGPRA